MKRIVLGALLVVVGLVIGLLAAALSDADSVGTAVLFGLLFVGGPPIAIGLCLVYFGSRAGRTTTTAIHAAVSGFDIDRISSYDVGDAANRAKGEMASGGTAQALSALSEAASIAFLEENSADLEVLLGLVQSIPAPLETKARARLENEIVAYQSKLASAARPYGSAT